MGKLETLRDVIEFSRAHDLPADVVGRWVWLRFPEKPPEETRALIKAAGFAWVKKRGQWAHSCGAYTWKRSKTPYEPRQKYGAVPVSAIDPEITS